MWPLVAPFYQHHINAKWNTRNPNCKFDEIIIFQKLLLKWEIVGFVFVQTVRWTVLVGDSFCHSQLNIVHIFCFSLFLYFEILYTNTDPRASALLNDNNNKKKIKEKKWEYRKQWAELRARSPITTSKFVNVLNVFHRAAESHCAHRVCYMAVIYLVECLVNNSVATRINMCY